MESLMDLLTKQMGGGALNEMSQRLGADEATTRTAMATALPTLLAALARNAQRKDGAAALHRAVAKDHDGSVLDNVSAFFGTSDLGDGNAILGHVLGNRRAAVEGGVSKTSGLDPQRAGQLMAMLAPLVMGALGRMQRQKNLDAGGLSTVLAGERQQLERQAPGLGGLASLLDADGDGQVADDILGKVGKGLLGSLFGRRR